MLVLLLLFYGTGVYQIWLDNCSLITLFVAGVRGAEPASSIRPTEAHASQPRRSTLVVDLWLVLLPAPPSAPVIGMEWRGMEIHLDLDRFLSLLRS